MSAPKTIAAPYEEVHDKLFLRVSMATGEHPDYEMLSVDNINSAVLVTVQKKGGERRQYAVPVEGLLKAFMEAD